MVSVKGTEIWSTGDFILNSYKSTGEGISDQFYLVNEDKIYDMLVANIQGDLVNNTVLACDDGNIKVLQNDQAFYSYKLNSQPYTIFDGYVDNVKRKEPIHSLFYGTKSGEFG